MSQEEGFQAELAAKKIDADKMAALIAADQSLIDRVFQELSNKSPRVKFGCSKALLLLSERRPELLYPKIDEIFKLLGRDNQIIKWSAIAILGNLAAVDRDHRIKGVLRTICGFLCAGELITANHAITALGKIARAFPEERAGVTARLLGIEQAVFNTDECRNIAIGKSILAMEMYVDPAHIRKDVLQFARSQTSNTRRATATKAKAFLRKCQ